MKLTPLPLRSDENGKIFDAGGLVVCIIRKWRLYMLSDKTSQAELVAVAKHFCVAVNHHNKLVGALKALMGNIPGALEEAKEIITELEKL